MTKRRDAWAEIDLEAVVHNVRTLNALTPATTQFMAVVKANAEGHGAHPVAKAALHAGAHSLGVATVGEGVDLRDAGIEAPILILNQPPKTALDEVVDRDLAVTATTIDFLYELAGAAQLGGKVARYHLKLNTGMNRLGVRPTEAVTLLQEAASLGAITLEGVFTHFATADIEGDWDAGNQVTLFDTAIRSIRDAGIDPGIVHAANSAATILMPEAHYDMVRCGIAVVGLQPSKHTARVVNLKPVMSVYANVVFDHEIGIGEGVGYGLDWVSGKPCSILTLPIGYADGIPRAASGKMEVLVVGKRAKQVGRVCMDQMMVAIDKNVGVVAGDTCVIVGTQADEAVTIDDIASAAGTINYEIACALGRRLERAYL